MTSAGSSVPDTVLEEAAAAAVRRRADPRPRQRAAPRPPAGRGHPLAGRLPVLTASAGAAARSGPGRWPAPTWPSCPAPWPTWPAPSPPARTPRPAPPPPSSCPRVGAPAPRRRPPGRRRHRRRRAGGRRGRRGAREPLAPAAAAGAAPPAGRALGDGDSPEAWPPGCAASTGFDRVMVYRFDAEWNGEVLAEDRPRRPRAVPRPALPRLRHPRPGPRAVRAAVAAHHPHLHLRGAAAGTGAGARARRRPAARPVSGAAAQRLPRAPAVPAQHGVAASMSISLLHGRPAVGLIACHHYAGPPARACRCGPPRSSSGAPRVAAAADRRRARGRRAGRGLEPGARPAHRAAVRAPGPARGGAHPRGRHRRRPRALRRGRGAPARRAAPARHHPAEAVSSRRCPTASPPSSRAAASCTRWSRRPLPPTPPGWPVRAAPTTRGAAASGVLAAPVVGGQPGDLVAWFRPEVLREVTWGGDPRSSKVVEDGGGHLRLSPRRSFAAWSETVRRTAVPWAPHEVEAALGLAQHLSDSMLREVERTKPARHRAAADAVLRRSSPTSRPRPGRALRAAQRRRRRRRLVRHRPPARRPHRRRPRRRRRARPGRVGDQRPDAQRAAGARARHPRPRAPPWTG